LLLVPGQLVPPLLPAKAVDNIALTAFTDVGRSAMGRSLGRRLRWVFVDLDKVIEAAKMRLREIFNERH
jgi:shikimate kinase